MAKPQNPEIEKLSKDLAVSRRRAQQIKAQGNAESSNEMQAVRLKKLLAECAFLEERLARLKRLSISVSEAEDYGNRIGRVVERFFDEGRTNWPTEHAGKTELQLQDIYDNAADEFKQRLREAIAQS